MENKKFDVNSLIGFVLIGAILVWMLYTNQDNETKTAEVGTPENQEVVTTNEVDETSASTENNSNSPATDSLALEKAKSSLGAFAYSATLPSARKNITTLENDVLELKVSNKGGQIIEAKLKNETNYNGEPIYIVKDNNASFNLQFNTTDNRTLNTKDLFFEPQLTKNGENNILSMKLKVSANEYLEYVYTLKPSDYMMDFSIRSQGLSNVINSGNDVLLDWQLKAFRHSKSITYENRYTEIKWEYDGDNDDYTGQGDVDEDEDEDITWIAFRQHFFSSILLSNSSFDSAKFVSKNLVQDDEVDTLFTKSFAATIPLKMNGGELNESMNWYYGPTDYKILNDYDRNLDEVVPLGWGIFGIINKYLVIPFFNLLSGFLPAGIAIIFLTISVKLLLSPVQYKQYVSQAKMKVLRPEINEINEKYKDNAMKKQQETMKLYSKAGASPMSGCLPALMQIPVFYALFNFFPSAFDLRQKSFLWAEDLSSYDVIAELPFTIPFYGDHISLFPILASIAIFIYMTMTTGQSMQQAQQPGMPNMKFIMYLSPLFMLVFFNNYASGLSLYYFTSNLITIGIMLVIKNFIIDDEKIHAKIQENKKKPKKKGKFAQKFQDMMEQAEQQQRNNRK
ncbi:membrane protein insertase YidC [Mesonia sp.]|uniref:membrane protein insertase YidC n=1 Tax=Mesonia sp. TaxID=1960830 RepID=UPI001753CFF1|nr:membrane protein insertase YidC [Mesonia sp.]HIB37454.1 membrane protein insertase YidC [Mesonia sp.]HIO27667.1 membrane protein insertase YidC [Flavobacteriaceae bacterium]